MVAGATGVNVALLVIAADDGVMPQTREHLEIMDLLGIGAGVVAITKIDLVEADFVELVEAEIEEDGRGHVPRGLPDGAGLVGDRRGARDRSRRRLLEVLPAGDACPRANRCSGCRWTGPSRFRATARLSPAA